MRSHSNRPQRSTVITGDLEKADVTNLVKTNVYTTRFLIRTVYVIRNWITVQRQLTKLQHGDSQPAHLEQFLFLCRQPEMYSVMALRLRPGTS